MKNQDFTSHEQNQVLSFFCSSFGLVTAPCCGGASWDCNGRWLGFAVNLPAKYKIRVVFICFINKRFVAIVEKSEKVA